MGDKPAPLEEEALLNPQVNLTKHAVLRFVERIRPGLDFREGKAELERLVSIGELRAEPPAWLPRKSRDQRYLAIGEDLVIPCAPDRFQPGALFAATCLCRGTLAVSHRERRNRNRASRRAARRVRGRSRGGRPLRRVPDWQE
jgi:hypothetical protein